MKEKYDLKSFHKKVALEAHAHGTSKKSLRGSPERPLYSMNKLKGELSPLKDELVETSD